jgi:hypothetical protein
LTRVGKNDSSTMYAREASDVSSVKILGMVLALFVK